MNTLNKQTPEDKTANIAYVMSIIQDNIISSDCINFLHQYLRIPPGERISFHLLYTSLIQKVEIKASMYLYAREVFEKADFIKGISSFLESLPELNSGDYNYDYYKELYLEGLQESITLAMSHAGVMHTLELPEEISKWYTTLFQNDEAHILMASNTDPYLIYKGELIHAFCYGTDEKENITYFVFSSSTDTYIYDHRTKKIVAIPWEVSWMIGKWRSEGIVTFTEKEEVCFSLNSGNLIEKPKTLHTDGGTIPTMQQYFFTQRKEYLSMLDTDTYTWTESDGKANTTFSKWYIFSKVLDILDNNIIYEWTGNIIDVISTDSDTYIFLEKPVETEILLDHDSMWVMKNSMEKIIYIYSVELEDYIYSFLSHDIYKTFSTPENLIIYHLDHQGKENIFDCREEIYAEDVTITDMEMKQWELFISLWREIGDEKNLYTSMREIDDVEKPDWEQVQLSPPTSWMFH